jgi:hypothetical protein
MLQSLHALIVVLWTCPICMYAGRYALTRRVAFATCRRDVHSLTDLLQVLHLAELLHNKPKDPLCVKALQRRSAAYQVIAMDHGFTLYEMEANTRENQHEPCCRTASLDVPCCYYADLLPLLLLCRTASLDVPCCHYAELVRLMCLAAIMQTCFPCCYYAELLPLMCLAAVMQICFPCCYYATLDVPCCHYAELLPLMCLAAIMQICFPCCCYTDLLPLLQLLQNYFP